MLTSLVIVLLIAVSGVLIWYARQNTELERQAAESIAAKQAVEAQAAALHQDNVFLARYRHIVHVEQEAARIWQVAQAQVVDATQRANACVATANNQAAALALSANQQASAIVTNAHQEAQRIAGEALKALHNVEAFRREAQALENVINGYGDRYLVPASSVLDDLAASFGHTNAGQALKSSRERTKALIKANGAAVSGYVEPNRRDTAVAFIVDAFNGKVDSILSRVKADNVGTLRQEMLDACTLVNAHGRAFRDTMVLDGYLQARLDELRWAAATEELKNQTREEQRQLKEQMREEEKARREYERALRDTEKEEEALQRAMEKVQRQVADASQAQRALYEAKLADLAQQLQAAHEKNQRALSMAQQTKRGTVYIISNVGSFGEDVYKIGLTRRLDPTDRIKELGDASVPFEFDVHALLSADDAPALEHQLHRHFLAMQMNKVNPRKEFFRVSLTVIRAEIEKLGLPSAWTMTAAAAEYRQSVAIEHAIRENPAAYQAWVNKQLVLDARAEAADSVELAEAS